MSKTINIKDFIENLCAELFQLKIGPARAYALLRGGKIKDGVITIAPYNNMHLIDSSEKGFAIYGHYEIGSGSVGIEADYGCDEALTEVSMIVNTGHVIIFAGKMLVDNLVEEICKYLHPKHAAKE
jgi:hypothetical protein